jgi:hypothetical protein
VTSNGAGGSGGANAQFIAGAPEYIPLIDELKRAYKNKILPLEAAYKFEEFHSQALTDTGQPIQTFRCQITLACSF